MPTEGTKKRIFRCPDDIWLPAVAVAAMRDENMSTIIRRALKEYTRTRGNWPPDSEE
jgi:hypothetical protein